MAWNKTIEEFIRESNAIEGVYGEEQFEDAKQAWKTLEQHTFISPHLIKEIHGILMQNRGAWSEPDFMKKYISKFRDCPVYIGGHEAMNSDLIPEAIQNWCYHMNTSKEKDEVKSKELHVEYESIHPFIDGNGRTGRMFMNWWRLQRGMGVLVIHADWPDQEGEQANYYKWFKQ